MTRAISAECDVRGVHLCASIIFFNVQHPPRIGLAQCTFIGPLIFSSDQIANQALRIFPPPRGRLSARGDFRWLHPPCISRVVFCRSARYCLDAAAGLICMRGPRARFVFLAWRAWHQHGDRIGEEKNLDQENVMGRESIKSRVRDAVRSHFEMKDGQL